MHRMRQIAITSLAFVSLALAGSLPVGAQDADNDTNAKGEAELAEILEGYEAGEPVKCLRRSQRDRLQIVDDTAFVFRDGRTIYVNRTKSPRHLDDFDVPVFRLFGSSLCRQDQVEMRSRDGHFAGPIVILSDFVPYTKVETES